MSRAIALALIACLLLPYFAHPSSTVGHARISQAILFDFEGNSWRDKLLEEAHARNVENVTHEFLVNESAYLSALNMSTWGFSHPLNESLFDADEVISWSLTDPVFLNITLQENETRSEFFGVSVAEKSDVLRVEKFNASFSLEFWTNNETSSYCEIKVRCGECLWSWDLSKGRYVGNLSLRVSYEATAFSLKGTAYLNGTERTFSMQGSPSRRGWRWYFVPLSLALHARGSGTEAYLNITSLNFTWFRTAAFWHKPGEGWLSWKPLISQYPNATPTCAKPKIVSHGPIPVVSGVFPVEVGDNYAKAVLHKPPHVVARELFLCVNGSRTIDRISVNFANTTRSPTSYRCVVCGGSTNLWVEYESPEEEGDILLEVWFKEVVPPPGFPWWAIAVAVGASACVVVVLVLYKVGILPFFRKKKKKRRK